MDQRAAVIMGSQPEGIVLAQVMQLRVERRTKPLNFPTFFNNLSVLIKIRTNLYFDA